MCHYCKNLQKNDEKFQNHINFSVIWSISTIVKTIKNAKNKKCATIVKTCKKLMKNFRITYIFSVISSISTIGKTIKNAKNKKMFLDKPLGISNTNQRNGFWEVIFWWFEANFERFYHIKSESGTKTRRKRPTAKRTPVLSSHFVMIFGEFWPFLPYQIGIRH